MESYGKILLVEDDVSLAKWVKEYLQEHSYEVVNIERGDTALAIFREHEFDLVLLDVMLPGLDGIQVCRDIRSESALPIIMMTARGDELDEVIGLEVGANDYVIKPVRPRALLARIQSLIRNQSVASTMLENEKQFLKFGRLNLDNTAKRVTLNEQEVEFSSSEFGFLWYLACHAGTEINRDQVFLALKGREYDGQDRRFDLMISILRKKLQDSSHKPQKIKTVWGKGYLFVADAWD